MRSHPWERCYKVLANNSSLTRNEIENHLGEQGGEKTTFTPLAVRRYNPFLKHGPSTA